MKMTLKDLMELQAMGSVVFNDCSVQILFGVGGGVSGGEEMPEDSGYQGCAIGFDSDPIPEEFEEDPEDNPDDFIEVPAGTSVC